MLSILIPVYNTSVFELVSTISKLAEALTIAYEIIVIDDASTASETLDANEFLYELKNCSYIKSKSNKGRTATSELLATTATYEFLLFLDADVLPASPQFLKNIINNHKQASVIFGGIQYEKIPPEPKKMLRYIYGIKREDRSLETRRKQPHLSITPAALFIKKDLYLSLEIPVHNSYGLDILLTYRLKQKEVPILHIENPVIHLGIEDSEAYLQKTYEGLQTLANLEEQNLISETYRPIQRIARRMQKSGLSRGYLKLFERVLKKAEKNLCSPRPSLKLFDSYRLYYFLKIKQDNA